MTPEQFITGLMQWVVEDNVAIYRELFGSTLPGDASNLYWKRALTLFNTLSPDQRSVFFEVIRQVCVDTTSNVLGVIDGVNFVDSGTEEFSLIYGRGEKISGDLQSLFLVEEERTGK